MIRMALGRAWSAKPGERRGASRNAPLVVQPSAYRGRIVVSFLSGPGALEMYLLGERTI
jgi:hypothetical protein